VFLGTVFDLASVSEIIDGATFFKKFGCCKFVALSVFAKWLFS